MPIVKIETWPLKSDDKPLLIKKITDVFVGMGLPAQAVTVIINEIPKDNWGSAGEQHSKKFQ
ncbi:4-oxalocrotonate tautomerase [archaeon CG06_land_8_20_14_3_00_37_11]|nr:MAG: 4-oxalocrotonate tautomerase [archaeon CG06_land_8_20_14_3_00_37_11]